MRDEYAATVLSTLSKQSRFSIGGNMDYLVSHEGKFVSVFKESAPEDEIRRYAAQGYKVAYFIRGNSSAIDVLRGIVTNRCAR